MKDEGKTGSVGGRGGGWWGLRAGVARGRGWGVVWVVLAAMIQLLTGVLQMEGRERWVFLGAAVAMGVGGVLVYGGATWLARWDEKRRDVAVLQNPLAVVWMLVTLGLSVVVIAVAMNAVGGK